MSAPQQAGMGALVEETWRATIRGWLVGRLGVGVVTEALASPAEACLTAPYLGWWIFDGLRLPKTERPISGSWEALAREAEQLLHTWNPRLMVVDRPEGRVDWERTLAKGPQRPRREFVSTTAGVGLGDDERAALLGWATWLLDLWRAWVVRVKLPEATVEASAPFARFVAGPRGGQAEQGVYTDAHLRRWAFTGRRSRWPLLREVVAPTLWAALNPVQAVDHLPLPGTRETLFQLYSVVRLAAALVSAPRAVRWLHRVVDSADADESGRLEMEDVVVEYECSLPRGAVLDASMYLPETREALGRHGVSVPTRIDAFIWWRQGVGPWAAILLEVKSGQRPPEDAVYQLLAYRAALRSRFPGRVLVWGMGESDAWRLTDVAGSALARGRREGGTPGCFRSPRTPQRYSGFLGGDPWPGRRDGTRLCPNRWPGGGGRPPSDSSCGISYYTIAVGA